MSNILETCNITLVSYTKILGVIRIMVTLEKKIQIILNRYFDRPKLYILKLSVVRVETFLFLF